MQSLDKAKSTGSSPVSPTREVSSSLYKKTIHNPRMDSSTSRIILGQRSPEDYVV